MTGGRLPGIGLALALLAAFAGCGGAPRTLLHGATGRAFYDDLIGAVRAYRRSGAAVPAPK